MAPSVRGKNRRGAATVSLRAAVACCAIAKAVLCWLAAKTRLPTSHGFATLYGRDSYRLEHINSMWFPALQYIWNIKMRAVRPRLRTCRSYLLPGYLSARVPVLQPLTRPISTACSPSSASNAEQSVDHTPAPCADLISCSRCPLAQGSSSTSGLGT